MGGTVAAAEDFAAAVVGDFAAAATADIVGGYGGYHGGNGGYHGGYAAPSFNRTPSFTQPRMTSVTPRSEFGNANRSGAFNEGNRFSNASVNRVNNFNNVNRMGLGWNNPYNGYHQGWNHGYWNGNLGGGWGWRPYGYGYGGYGLGGYGLGGFGYGLAGGLGMGLGWGLSSWMYGPMLNNWGYSNYNNPYYGGGYGYGGNVASRAADRLRLFAADRPPKCAAG